MRGTRFSFLSPPIKTSLSSVRTGPRWIGTLLYIPALYGLGWLLARPLAQLAPSLRPDQVNLTGAFAALTMLLLTLPWRLAWVWGCSTPWKQLGVLASPLSAGNALVRGLLKAGFMLAGVVLALMAFGVADWRGQLDGGEILNAIALMFGVGFAEELIFRGWLLGELQQQLSKKKALMVQAIVFGLVHPWAANGGLGAVALLGGLTLLGVSLALQRKADGGLLWGAVGLHGGLVGGWFALQAGLIEVSLSAPAWLVGPGTTSPNPIGGVLGWIGLSYIVLTSYREW